MSRKRDPIESAVRAYRALDTDGQAAFHRHLRLLAEEDKSNTPRLKRGSAPIFPGGRPRKVAGQQPEVTMDSK